MKNNMILKAEQEGLIGKDTIIVEPTSGNQGIGLALVGAVKGYETIIIMPDSVSEERRFLVEHYGAKVVQKTQTKKKKRLKNIKQEDLYMFVIYMSAVHWWRRWSYCLL